jgi:outer membrane protein insertion porin family
MELRRLTTLVCLFGLISLEGQSLASNVIERVEFRGLSRVPTDTVRAIVQTKSGDVYEEKAVKRDFKALWDTGRFTEVQVTKEDGPRGGIILRFVVTERPQQP